MKRDQTVYTCDGCRTTQAYDYASMPPGWYTVGTAQVSKTSLPTEYHLCLRCFSGVDWILRFQGLTVPPAVVADPKPIRRHTDAPCDVEPILDPAIVCPAVTEHDQMQHCGLCGWEPTYDVIKLPLTRDTLPVDQMWLDGGMKYSSSDGGFPRITGILRGHWPRLGHRDTRPGEEHDLTVTVVDLVETADGHLHRTDGGPHAPEETA